MRTSFTRFGLLLAVLFLLSTAGKAQTVIGGPENFNFCSANGGGVVFNAYYFNFGGASDPTSFTATTSFSSVTTTVPPLSGGITDSETTVSGVTYELVVSRANGSPNFTLVLNITGDITSALDMMSVTFNSNGAAPHPVSSATKKLFVKDPITVTIDSPFSLTATGCEGGMVTIEASTIGVPDSYEWVYNNAVVVQSGTGVAVGDLVLDPLALADEGDYRVVIYDAACPDVVSEIVDVFVAETVVIDGSDIKDKQLLPGQTVTFSAPVDNVDFTSTYTWTVNGSDYTSASVPATFTVGGNDFQINSIVNTPTGPTSTTSVISISNTSAPGAPGYNAPVELTVTNNSLCAASLPAVLSGPVSIFPVEWAAFTAQRKSDKDVLLAWQTATESNNEKFVVERSINGRTFDAIGTVAGAGSSQSLQNYQWIDGQLPTSSTLYYRIQQVDYDGQFSYSDVRTVSAVRGGSDWKISPVTLVGEQASVYLTDLDTQAQATYRLFDARGVLVSSGSVPALVDGQAFTFLAPQQRGMYVLQVLADGEQVSRSFVR